MQKKSIQSKPRMLWLKGARPATLPLALAPIFVGWGAAQIVQSASPGLIALATLVAVALQIGVNYANDYADGVRGTDQNRKGPLRLVGSGLVPAKLVLRAALLSFAVAGLAGLAISVITGHWWLLAIGAVAILAAWLYTGGRNPYGYAGLGELVAFCFFGPVAAVGTAYIQLGYVSDLALWGGLGCGGYAAAVLLVNNIRDRDGDRAVNKHTLAVRLGLGFSKTLYILLVVLPLLGAIFLAQVYTALIYTQATWLLVAPAILICLMAKTPKDYVTSLKLSVFGGLCFGVSFGFGVAQAVLGV